jgi:hypothetical protein
MKHLRTMASIDDELDSGLTRVDPADIRDYIGDADASLLRTLLSLARTDLTMDEIAVIRNAIRAASAA